MYDGWYLKQFDHFNDSHSSEWETFGLKFQGDGTRLGPIQAIANHEILDWIIDQRPDQPVSHAQTGQIGLGGLQLLFTRHQKYKSKEIKPWFMAFPKPTFLEISNAMMLPPSYYFLRSNAGGSGDFARYSTFGENGVLSTLAFVIRVPHSPHHEAHKSTWSFAVSWNARTGVTSGFFEGMSDDDMDNIAEYTSSKFNQSVHPLFFPAVLLDILTSLYIHHRKDLERGLFVLEDPTGISRGPRESNAWDWDYNLYRETTTHCNTIYTNLVYLERRLDFTVRLSNFILESLKYFEDQNTSYSVVSIYQIEKQIEEGVRNAHNFAASQLHQTICLQKRSQALITVIYTIITQQDSRTNVKIAKAAKVDSTSMTAIALLGIIFLPAMLVASMFSMSMFDFSQSASPQSSTSTSVVKPNFWIYWAVTIPLTLLILALWKLWMGINRARNNVVVHEPLTQRVKTYREKVDGEMEVNTPFYPGKGSPGSLLLGKGEDIV